MGIRHTVARSLERTVGAGNLDRLRTAESSVRSKLIDVLDVEGVRNLPGAGASSRRPSREEIIEILGREAAEGGSLAGASVSTWASSDPFASFPEPTGSCLSVLGGLHQVLQPRTYLEIGIRTGASLARSRARSVGIDPAYDITVELECDLRLFRTTSDDFFRRPDAFDHFGTTPVDFAFIDGMHLAEFALRDFMNLEKHMAAGGVVVLDDMLPRNSLEAFRIRRTGPWAGDVYKVHEVLDKHRPDLTIIPVNSAPTGVVVIVGLDPTSTVLDEHYREIEKALTRPDPQVVPQERLERRRAVDAAQLLGLEVWQRLVELRNSGADREALAPLWAELAALPRVGA